MADPLHSIAKQVFDQHGPRLSVSDIAARAGVSRSTVYQRLGSKADILRLFNPDDGAAPADIEDRIMAAVLKAALHSGVRAATIEAIARRAGVGPATIYRRYGDKDGLLRRFIARHAPVTGIRALPLGKGPVRAQLRALIGFLLTYMHDNRDIVRLIQNGSAEDRAYLRALREADQSTSRRIAAFFEAQQRAGTISAEIPAPLLAANLAGMLYAHTLFEPTAAAIDPQTGADAILRMFDAVIIEETP